MTDTHNHSGDRLGEEEPVASIRARESTVEEFGMPDAYLVFEHGNGWHAMETASQDVVFTDKDGVRVINETLARLESDDGIGGGTVRVTAPGGGSVIESATTLEHTADGVGLILEDGITLRYVGDSEAVLVAGEKIHFEFDRIEAGGAPYCVRDLGLENSFVEGKYLNQYGKSAWFADAENQRHVPDETSRTYVHIDAALPEGEDSDYGIEMTSAPGARYVGYRIVLMVINAPTNEAGILLGDRSDATTVTDTHVIADIASSDPLCEINDGHNSFVLKAYLPGPEYDVVVRESADDAFTHALTFPITRVKRSTPSATDFTRQDAFKRDVIAFDLLPDSLEGYRLGREGSARVENKPGHVELATGKESDSRAVLEKRVPLDYGELTFDHAAVLQTSASVASNADQRIYATWGDPNGSAVGWRIVDDRLEGYVSDDGEATTLPLREGFDPGTTWSLSAFYYPDDEVCFHVEDATVARSEETTGSDDAYASSGVTISTDGGDSATVSTGLPSGKPDAQRVLYASAQNTAASKSALRWSLWRNHHHPIRWE